MWPSTGIWRGMTGQYFGLTAMRVMRPHKGSNTSVSAGSSLSRSRDRGHQAPSRSPREVPSVLSARRAAGGATGSWCGRVGCKVADMMRTRLRTVSATARVSSLTENDPAWKPVCEIPSVRSTVLRACQGGCGDDSARRRSGCRSRREEAESAQGSLYADYRTGLTLDGSHAPGQHSLAVSRDR